jgi:hypothetical protein
MKRVLSVSVSALGAWVSGVGPSVSVRVSSDPPVRVSPKSKKV